MFFEQEPEFTQADWEKKYLMISVYYRVSTENDNQATSFALQKNTTKNLIFCVVNLSFIIFNHFSKWCLWNPASLYGAYSYS